VNINEYLLRQKGSEELNFNNRGYQQYYGTGCSMLGCFIMLLVLGFFISGSIFFFFRNFWLILILGVVIWLFRKFITSDNDADGPNNQRRRRGQDWRRDYENNDKTGYDNVDRDFEEVDDEETEDDDDDEFNDF